MEKRNSSAGSSILYARELYTDDEVFLRALRSQHRGAQAEFYRRYAEYIERIVQRVMGSDSEIPDLVQEAFFHALKGLPSFRGGAESLKPWLTRIAVLRVRKRLRHRKSRSWLRIRRDSEMPERVSSGASPDVAHALVRTYRLLDELSTDDRIVLSLRLIDQMELTEIADACEISLATVKRRLASARQRFEQRARRDPILVDWIPGGENGR